MIERIPFAPRSPAAEKPFTRLEAREIGIDKPVEFSMVDMWPPFWNGRSVSASDLDNDGDQDIVMASTKNKSQKALCEILMKLARQKIYNRILLWSKDCTDRIDGSA